MENSPRYSRVDTRFSVDGVTAACPLEIFLGLIDLGVPLGVRLSSDIVADLRKLDAGAFILASSLLFTWLKSKISPDRVWIQN